LRAIVSHFLQRNFKNISYVRGGYEGTGEHFSLCD
jgi:hypothetical protein